MSVEALRKILREEFGITSDEELDEAIRKMKKPDIGLFTVALA